DVCSADLARPATATQHLAAAEPRLRVVLVGIGIEAREGQEVRRGPFPDIADHLAADEGAVALAKGRDIDRPVAREVEMGARRCRRPVAPWPATALVRETGAVGRRQADRGGFPFGLARQS